MRRRHKDCPRSRFRFPFIQFVTNLDDGVTVVVNGKTSCGCSSVRVIRYFGSRGKTVVVLVVTKLKKEGGGLFSLSLNGAKPKPDDWFSKPYGYLDAEKDGVVWANEKDERLAVFSWPKA